MSGHLTWLLDLSAFERKPRHVGEPGRAITLDQKLAAVGGGRSRHHVLCARRRALCSRGKQ